jgi:hypothetical protein
MRKIFRKNGENRERTRRAKSAVFHGLPNNYKRLNVRYAKKNQGHSSRRLQSLQYSGGECRKESDMMKLYTESDFRKILLEYPDVVTKEQLYRLCHVSKRVATFYLEQGFLPCEKRNTKTHKYLIKTADIVAFLRKRQDDPLTYCVPAGTSRQPVGGETQRKKTAPRECPLDLSSWRAFLSEALADRPDVCSVPEITRICGYSKETVFKWCEAGKFIFFNINRAYHVPKRTFIDFMACAEFATIAQKSGRHWELLEAFKSQTG